MSDHKNLIWFNKENDALNFNYNENEDRFEGNILFHENSNDTFKTYGLYLFEKIEPIEFELPENLTTEKFQLFNENGINFYNGKYENQQVSRIEPVNNHPMFYSKWIYGVDFEKKFPIGTLISFNSQVLEFNDPDRLYSVISTKKDAIMILSDVDNKNFEDSYSSQYLNSDFYINNPILISAKNVIGLYDYLYGSQSNFSEWNERNFHDKYYVNKKLNIVNSNENDGIYTINNIDYNDQKHYEYYVNKNELNDYSNLIIKLETRTNLPKLYEGSIDIDGNKVYLDPFSIPSMLKPGVEFKIEGSQDNKNFLTVKDVLKWDTIVNEVYFDVESQVIYDNKIYECVDNYTQSFSDQNSQYITPENSDKWSNRTHVKVDQNLITETISNGELYLTTNEFEWEITGTTNSSETTLNKAVDILSEKLDFFKVDISYEDNFLKADLYHPDQYVIIDFYENEIGASYSIGSYSTTKENLIGVKEKLVYERNLNYVENFRKEVVFTNIDDYGILINVLGMPFRQDVQWIYNGFSVDMDRTIDKTLINWYSKYYMPLAKMGIITELEWSGFNNSVFKNTIIFRTQYPNVPFEIKDIQTGLNGDFYIKHSNILFESIGSYFNLNINGEDYGITPIFQSNTNITNISETLTKWVDRYQDQLYESNIEVNNIFNSLEFNLKSANVKLNYEIQTNQVELPGVSNYKISEKIKGNNSLLMSSNEVVLSDSSAYSFLDENFSTGMVLSLNNTKWPYVNNEFNILYLDDGKINLSYEGPFWGLTQGVYVSNGFANIIFGPEYGLTGSGLTQSGGDFSIVNYDSSFNIVDGDATYTPLMSDYTYYVNYIENTYSTSNFSFDQYSETNNLKDIEYVGISDKLYLLGDGLTILYASNLSLIDVINFTNSGEGIKIIFNEINQYIYCLSKNKINIINPVNDIIEHTINIPHDAYDMEINQVNGDVFVSYGSESRMDIWDYNNFSDGADESITAPIKALVYNENDESVYCTTDNVIIKFDVNRDPTTIDNDDSTLNISHSIFYEPEDESIYFHTTDKGLYKIEYKPLNDEYDLLENPIGLEPTTLITSGPTVSFSVEGGMYNNFTSEMAFIVSPNSGSYPDQVKTLNISNDQFNKSKSIGSVNNIGLSQYDGNIYVTSENKIIIINSRTFNTDKAFSLSDDTTKIIYNPSRKSMIAIQPDINSITEVKTDLNSLIETVDQNLKSDEEYAYGTLEDDYKRENFWIKSREYLRTPKENFSDGMSVQYYYKWVDNDQNAFFMYDFSGDQLPTAGSYAYTGEKPLPTVVLNKKPNRNLDKIDEPEYQQTIFENIEYTLPFIDDSDNLSVNPSPLELFLGFRSDIEGAFSNKLQLYKKEEVKWSLQTDSDNYIQFNNNEGIPQIILNRFSTENFTKKGFKPGQIVVIYLEDTYNDNNQYTSDNHASMFKIKGVYSKKIVLDFINENDFLIEESTIIENYPNQNNTTYLKFTLKVKDKEIGNFNVYGQTEEEDERFKIELGNIGKLINPDEVFIFKEYDINEGGIDWLFLNQKRKEMLMMKHLIYPYIGAYKSIINAINYFGYNDLKLNEYYRNVNPDSENFFKLFKVEIPNIFQRNSNGWDEIDFLKPDMNQNEYEGINQFNLTYNVTDIMGNNLETYSLDEIIIKLQGLKYWLQRNIIPLTHKIADITGQFWINHSNYILPTLYDVKNFKTEQEITPVTFKIEEAYLNPVENDGSGTYTLLIDFYSMVSNLGSELDNNIKPFYNSNPVPPEQFSIKIRTYQNYKKWDPTYEYSLGDRIEYNGYLYESTVYSNLSNNPEEYKNISEWDSSFEYQTSNIVEYRREYYVYSSDGSTQSTIPPNLDDTNWVNVTKWKKVDMRPIQTIKELRKGNDLNPYTFTIDSSIDPYIVVQVKSDNGYGQIYIDQKNYKIENIDDNTNKVFLDEITRLDRYNYDNELNLI